MANKPKFTKESIIEAGLKQLKYMGWEGLTPQKVAKRLGASTMPIFSHFSSMEDYKKALLDRAWEIMHEYSQKKYTGDQWVDQSIGYMIFARDHGQIFNCMHSGKPEEVQIRRHQFWVFISKNIVDHPSFKGMDPEIAGWLRLLRTFLTYGIAVSVSSGLSPTFENEDVIKQMMSLCSELLLEGLPKKRDKLDNLLNLIPLDVRERISGISLK